MDKGRNLFQKSINQEENALRQAEKEINEKRDTISGEDFQLLVKDFEVKVASIQKLVQKSRQQLETNFQLSQKLIADTVNDLVIVGRKRKLLIVFKSDNIIYVNDEINYTSIILEELNNRESQFNFKNIYRSNRKLKKMKIDKRFYGEVKSYKLSDLSKNIKSTFPDFFIHAIF